MYVLTCQYINSIGFPVDLQSDRMTQFMEAFDRSGKEALNQQEFIVLSMYLKDIAIEPLDGEKTRVCNRFDFTYFLGPF